MSDIQPSKPTHGFDVRRDYGKGGPSVPCAYCGAPLDPFFYFCLRCATPYKPAMSMVGPQRPAPLTDGDRINKMAPHTFTLFWTFAAVIVAMGVIAYTFHGENSTTFYFLATLAILVTTAIFASIHWRPLKAQLSQIGFLKWQAWAGLATLLPLLSLNYAYISAIRHFAGPEAVAHGFDDFSLPVGILIVCLFPAITEEIAFRGLIQYWLDISLTPGKALLLGCAMFAGLHASIISFPYLFLVGATLTWTRRQTGSLYPGMLIHFLHNLAVITLFRF